MLFFKIIKHLHVAIITTNKINDKPAVPLHIPPTTMQQQTSVVCRASESETIRACGLTHGSSNNKNIKQENVRVYIVLTLLHSEHTPHTQFVAPWLLFFLSFVRFFALF